MSPIIVANYLHRRSSPSVCEWACEGARASKGLCLCNDREMSFAYEILLIRTTSTAADKDRKKVCRYLRCSGMLRCVDW